LNRPFRQCISEADSGELIRLSRTPLVIKHYFFDPCNVMILDPTSLTMKNVTPHCSQIQDILDFFKRANASLEALENGIIKTFEENSRKDLEETSETEIREVLDSMMGDEKASLLSRVLRVRPCAECFRDIHQL
jgi:hypothetical protein